MGNVVAFRVEIGAPTHSRTLDERVFVRMPAVYRALSKVGMRLNPRSRLRRDMLRRSVPSSFAAFNRRDFEPVFVQFAPDVEYDAPTGANTLGLSGTIHGRE